MTSTDNSLICFKAISNFTSELGELFSKQQRSLKLYSRLINKTTLVHDNSIKKHIDAFRRFCITNRDSIVSKDSEKLVMHKISYSQRVFIDISEIFTLADKDTKNVIWDHLLCISALVDPAGKAKEILRENLKSGKTGNDETNFLSNIIDKVEEHVDPNANPMEAVSSIMKSGIFTELIGGMDKGLSSGNLDIGKLMGAVQGMVGKLSNSGGEGSDGGPDPMSMITSMMGSMGNLGGGGDGNSQTPDLAGIMQGMMKSMASPPPPSPESSSVIETPSVNSVVEEVSSESV